LNRGKASPGSRLIGTLPLSQVSGRGAGGGAVRCIPVRALGHLAHPAGRPRSVPQ
jgi:hypothetical protein